MSETAKHTPGPWKHDTDFKFYEKDKYNCIVAGNGCLGIGGFTITGCMADADALLIAAAPELLEALQELVDIVEGVRSGDTTMDSFTTQVAIAAITKATGGVK